MMAVVRILYRNSTNYTSCKSCFLIYGISIIRSLPLFFWMILKEPLTFLSDMCTYAVCLVKL